MGICKRKVSAVDEDLPCHIVVDHDDERADDEIHRIGEEMDFLLEEKEIIEEGLDPDTDKKADDRKEEEDDHALSGLGSIRLGVLVDHEGGHQIIDDDTDKEAASRCKDRDIDGLISREGLELDEVADGKVEDGSHKANDGKAEDFPEEIVGKGPLLHVKLIEKVVIERTDERNNERRKKGRNPKSRKNRHQDNMGKKAKKREDEQRKDILPAFPIGR